MDQIPVTQKIGHSQNMCEPEPGADLATMEGRINNLFFGALSWVLLHEIAHVHHGHSHLIPASMKVGQEYQADAFATMWVLDDAGNGLQREFRVLAVSVALAWLFLHEQAKGQGSDHPEPPLVSERLICPELRRLFQGCSALHGIHPPFLAAADGR